MRGSSLLGRRFQGLGAAACHTQRVMPDGAEALPLRAPSTCKQQRAQLRLALWLGSRATGQARGAERDCAFRPRQGEQKLDPTSKTSMRSRPKRRCPGLRGGGGEPFKLAAF